MRVHHVLVAIASPLFLGLAGPSLAGMTWTARAVDPSLIPALKTDSKLLRETLFGEPLPSNAYTEVQRKDGVVIYELNRDKEVTNALTAWAEKRKAEVGDTEVDLDKAWHGIHYLLTGSIEPNGTLASKVIMGGEAIGPDQGYGPAQLLQPDEVKEIAQLLDRTTPDTLRQRFKPKEMTRAGVYPAIIWERDGNQALEYVLDDYKMLVA